MTHFQGLPDRIRLIRILNSLVPQQFNELLWYINPPRGIVPAPPAPQADRVYALLTWAESPTGYGLSQIGQALDRLQPQTDLVDTNTEGFISETESKASEKNNRLSAFRPKIESKSQVQIFLAHAREDSEAVTKLYDRLQEKGYKPWLDKKDLIAGQNFPKEISKAIRSSQFFIACLSRTSVSKRGYIQKEFKSALSIMSEMPEDMIYLIPLRLDDCEVPDLQQPDYGVKLRDIHWLDYWEPDGFEKLVGAIEYQRSRSTSVPLSPQTEPETTGAIKLKQEDTPTVENAPIPQPQPEPKKPETFVATYRRLEVLPEPSQEEAKTAIKLWLDTEQELVALYNKNPGGLPSKLITEVSPTAPSMMALRSGKNTVSILERVTPGTYWVFKRQEDYYLVPNPKRKLSIFVMESILFYFKCHNYQGGTPPKDYRLIKPARISLSLGDSERWELLEKGEISF